MNISNLGYRNAIGEAIFSDVNVTLDRLDYYNKILDQMISEDKPIEIAHNYDAINIIINSDYNMNLYKYFPRYSWDDIKIVMVRITEISRKDMLDKRDMEYLKTSREYLGDISALIVNKTITGPSEKCRFIFIGNVYIRTYHKILRGIDKISNYDKYNKLFD